MLYSTSAAIPTVEIIPPAVEITFPAVDSITPSVQRLCLVDPFERLQARLARYRKGNLSLGPVSAHLLSYP